LDKFTALISDKNRPINREYEDILEQVYDIELEPVDFRRTDDTLRTINDKVNQKTRGQIPELLTRDDLLGVS